MEFLRMHSEGGIWGCMVAQWLGLSPHSKKVLFKFPNLINQLHEYATRASPCGAPLLLVLRMGYESTLWGSIKDILIFTHDSCMIYGHLSFDTQYLKHKGITDTQAQGSQRHGHLENCPQPWIEKNSNTYIYWKRYFFKTFSQTCSVICFCKFGYDQMAFADEQKVIIICFIRQEHILHGQINPGEKDFCF